MRDDHHLERLLCQHQGERKVRVRRVAVAVLPGGEGRAAEHHHRRRDAVGDDAEGPEGLQRRAKFFTFLSSPAIQVDWHEATGYVPITLAAYEETKKSGFYAKNPGFDVAINELSGKAPTPNSKGLRLGNFVQIRNVIDEELEAVWGGKKTAKAALDNAVKRGNELLAKFEKANK